MAVVVLIVKNLNKCVTMHFRNYNIDASVEKVTDLQEIMKTGILSTPGLEINGKMISSGKLPTKSTLIHWIQDNIN